MYLFMCINHIKNVLRVCFHCFSSVNIWMNQFSIERASRTIEANKRNKTIALLLIGFFLNDYTQYSCIIISHFLKFS